MGLVSIIIIIMSRFINHIEVHFVFIKITFLYKVNINFYVTNETFYDVKVTWNRQIWCDIGIKLRRIVIVNVWKKIVVARTGKGACLVLGKWEGLRYAYSHLLVYL